jgi:phosphatidylserine/phosphatidylglycerophosphate/cardiolipin synthase-like enzyme
MIFSNHYPAKYREEPRSQNLCAAARKADDKGEGQGSQVMVGRELRRRGWKGTILLLACSMIGCQQEPAVTFLANEAYFEVLTTHLAQAKRDVLVSMFLFAPGEHENNRATQVREALIRAAKRGVRVVVLLDISEADDFSTEANRGVAADLERHGITVRFDSPGRTTHTKLVIIDQRLVLLGSHNFTHSALRHNNEASVLIESPKLAQQALNYVQHISELSAQEQGTDGERRRRPARQSR